MQKSRIVTLRRARGDRNWPLNDRQIPNLRVVRVHVSTSYNRAEVKSTGVAKQRRRELISHPISLPLRFSTFDALGAGLMGSSRAAGFSSLVTTSTPTHHLRPRILQIGCRIRREVRGALLGRVWRWCVAERHPASS